MRGPSALLLLKASLLLQSSTAFKLPGTAITASLPLRPHASRASKIEGFRPHSFLL